MKYVTLGTTDVKVSQLCLGTSNYGSSQTEEWGFHVMDRFLDAGGNFLDTAKVYGDFGPFKSASENTIGKWLTARGNRDKVIIATKGGHPIIPFFHESRVGAAFLEDDLNASLTHLQTDYIDLYFAHRDNPAVPVEELVDWFHKQQQAGKIRYYGCSNWSLDRIKAAQEYAAKMGYTGFVASEQMYSLADANAKQVAVVDMHVLDAADREYHAKTGMAMMAYMSLAGGYLMKKIRGGEINDRQKGNYDNAANEAIVQWLEANLKGTEYTIEDMCMNFLLTRPFNSIALASFSSDVQMDAILKAVDKEVPKEMIDALAALKTN